MNIQTKTNLKLYNNSLCCNVKLKKKVNFINEIKINNNNNNSNNNKLIIKFKNNIKYNHT